MNCPQCREELKDSARFCSNCGLSFASFNTPTERVDLSGEDETLTRPDPLIGHVLDSKYQLLARLGEGGMGAVYRAQRILIGDEVAVKVLLGKFVADKDAIERFRREARAAAMLRHPNVVTIHDFGEARGDEAPAYIVMELVEGESLRDLLRRESRVEPGRAVALIRNNSAGVGAAHRRNIWHRDLKPDNVIVLAPDEDRESETVKVLDFGIAKLRDLSGGPTLTQTGVVMGTPYYMSPEQCRGEQLDARSDVYSLGAMLYEMLDGLPPFTANNSTGVIAKHLTEAPRPLSPDSIVPPALEAVMMRALAKDPEERQSDAAAFSRELQASLKQKDAPLPARTIAAQVPSAPQPTQASRQADVPASKRPEVENSGFGTPAVGLSTDPISLSKIGLTESAATSQTRRKSRLPLVLGLAALLAAVVVGVVWMTRTGEEKKQTATSTPTSTAPSSTNRGGGAVVRNQMGMEMVYVPAGSFKMGSEKYDSEKPVHQVIIREGFYMGRYEVTQAQWQQVMGSNPSYFKGENLPVEQVSWDDASSFIAKLNARNDGYTYRLPTEAEWEYACRAGTTGDYAGDIDAMAWYYNNAGDAPLSGEWNYDKLKANNNRTHPVGSKQPNAFGLYDMHGNVNEWCQDWYHDSYAGAPTDGSAWLSGGEQKYRVLRGGSWYNDAYALRSASRLRLSPDNRGSSIGLRVVAVARAS